MYWKKKETTSTPEETTATTVPGVMGQSFLAASMSALLKVAAARLDHYFGRQEEFVQPGFELTDDDSPLARYVIDNHLSIEEYITLMLAISPHAHPDLFTSLIRQYMPKGGDFPEFGGVKGNNYRGIIPTGETALFLLAGMNIDMRLHYASWLRGEVYGGNVNGSAIERPTIFQSGVITLEDTREGEPEMSGRLLLSQSRLAEFLTGRKWRPSFGSNFPATLLETKMEWSDIVISRQTDRELKMIRHWLRFHGRLESDANLGRRTKPGYRALFYGPPGTGKTLTASLLGKQFGLDVYRIDLSLVVSKYIGETEKNLQQIFDRAEDWILFFDEADALFGKRTNVQSAHDRFANQEVSYLLQKIEEHPGLVILATNFRNNMDQAFIRRFQTVVPFNAPNEQESLVLWNNTMPADIPWNGDISLQDFARKYELTGASILNIVQAASIRALSEDRPIDTQDLLEGIQHEYYKNGKSV